MAKIILRRAQVDAYLSGRLMIAKRLPTFHKCALDTTRLIRKIGTMGDHSFRDLAEALVLTLFAVYAWRGVEACFRAPDNFGRFLALGITVMVASQALINLGVVMGMMPTKGIPLPFISYGGSSLFVMLVGTGVLLNISQQTGEAVRG